MNIEQLQYMCMVAKTNSITIAAENLYVTQQTISKAINKLEQELGTTLMVRSHKGVQLTETGQIFVERASKIVRDFQELYDVTHAVTASAMAGQVQLYYTNYLSHILGAKYIIGLRKNYPKMKVFMEEMLASDIIERLKDGDSAIGLIPMVNRNAGVGRQEDLEEWLEFEPICRDTLVALVSEKSALAKRESITLKELTRQPIVWGDSFHMEDILLQDYDVETNVLLKSSNVNLQQNTIKEDAAVSFATEMIVHGNTYDTTGMKILPIKDNLRLETYLVRNKNNHWNKQQLAAIEELKVALKQL